MQRSALRPAVLTSAAVGAVSAGAALLLASPAGRYAALQVAAVAACLSGIAAGVYAHRQNALLARLEQALQRLAAGDFRARLLTAHPTGADRVFAAFNRAAENLQARTAALEEAQRRLAAVLAHAAEGVILTNTSGEVLLINPAAARLLHTDAATATARMLAEIAPFPGLVSLLETCTRSPEPQTDLVEVRSRGLVLQVTAAAFDNGNRCLLMLRDLSHIRRLETMRRDFVSNLSHELRTPLAGMKAVVETLHDGAMEDPRAADRFLQRLEDEVDNLTQMVEEMLALSRIESGQENPRMERLWPVEIVTEPVQRLMSYAERAGVTLKVQLPNDLPPVLADRHSIQRVVLNLLHNAIKFTPPGGEVVVTAAEEGDEVVFTVRDNGRGIPADNLPRIFERFYKSRHSQGSGLGLAIAKHTVQMHGGRIWAESVEGRGSAFHFTLSKGNCLALGR